MKRYIAFLFFVFNITLNAQVFNEIEFKGDIDLIAGEFSRDTLLKVCHIEYPPFYKFWKSEPIFTKRDIPKFVDRLRKYTNSLGYYRAVIKSKTKDNKIVIFILKSEPIKIKSILLDGEFKKYSLLRVGRRFKTEDFTKTKKGIRRYLEESGYPTYQMDSKAVVNLDRYRVDINITIDKGEKRFFGKSDINNSSKMDNELIKKQIKYKEGDIFNVVKIEETYDNIYKLGVFDTIKIEPDFNVSTPKIPVNIYLQEGETKEFNSKLGYDTYEGFRGGMEYIDHNLFGNLREFKIGWKVTQKGYRAYTSIYDPRVYFPLLGYFSIKNELDYKKWEFDGYDEDLIIERVTFGKRLFNIEHLFGFQLENNKVKSDNGALLSGSYAINSLFYKFRIDKRDSKMDAKNGYYTSLYLEKSMVDLASDIDYFKVLLEQRFIKSRNSYVYALKARFGWLSQETPIFKHFFAGGAMSNRGYEYRDLGPSVEGDPIGGVGLIDTSFEVRRYFNSKFAGVVFMDSSMLSSELNEFNSRWRRSYGFGVRYITIIGPLRFDIGFKEGYYKSPVIHFGIGEVF
jgi:translocation and assembly module TamA